MKHWFLPAEPDVLGILRAQAATTVSGLEAFQAWSNGDATFADTVREIEYQADVHRRQLQTELRRAFSVPLDAEDIYVLSERLDAVMNAAKNAVRESQLMEMQPDAHFATMAAHAAEGVRHLAAALGALNVDHDRAIAEADAAVATERDLEHAYRLAMSDAMKITDVRELFGRRELYRRCARMGEAIVSVAERVWYAVVKQG